MESKIEKIEGSYDIPILKDKLNRVIDYLNSQDQEEITAEQLCEDNRRRMEKLINKEMDERGFVRKVKDTPEEYKEKFVEWGLWSLVEDISDDGDGEGDNLQLTKEGKEASRMIKQLLDERKREVLEEAKKIIDEESIYSGGECGTPLELLEWFVDTGVDKLNKEEK